MTAMLHLTDAIAPARFARSACHDAPTCL